MRSAASWTVLAAAFAIVDQSACAPTQPIPGDLLGAFEFTTTVPLLLDGGVDWDSDAGPVPDLWARSTCSIPELPLTNFSFQGTFSMDPPSGHTWFTVNGITDDAGPFDGQFIESERSAPRQFQGCADAGVIVHETVRVALVSASEQAWLAAIGAPVDTGGCLFNSLDGGLPPPAGTLLPTDGGPVLLPAFTPEGFDAVQACGVLVDVLEVQPDPTGGECVDSMDASMDGCIVHFPIAGVRQ